MNSTQTIALVAVAVAVIFWLFDSVQQSDFPSSSASFAAPTATVPTPIAAEADRAPITTEPDKLSAMAVQLPTADEDETETTTSTAGSLADTQQSAGYDHEGALAEAEALLSTTELSVEDEARLALLQDQLTVHASINPKLRARLTALIKDDPTHPLAVLARVILVQLGVPEALDLGLELAESQERDRLLAGLEILSELRPEDEQVVVVADSALTSYSGDADILLAAVQAMPATYTDGLTDERIIASLNTLASSGHSDVRSASLFAIARRARDSIELSAVVRALDSEKRDDRVSAVMALQKSQVSSNDLGSELVSRMIDQNELWEVRRIAADSLVRFDLTDEQQSQIAQFRQEQLEVAQGN